MELHILKWINIAFKILSLSNNQKHKSTSQTGFQEVETGLELKIIPSLKQK